ncbi:MAG: DUF1992 domain-containing protein [Caldilinea sp.]|nr:DUF1992 domain-containing protein [Caldilinea sp.]MDW8442405.1 DUF1992 domain-containing protein [Caldilineaceae bacterium]
MSKKISNPKQRAEEYRRRREETVQQEPQESSGHRTPEQWRDLISQCIEEAMREGKFDNLPGKGKPLDLTPQPYVPADMQMANSLLKNNGLAPAWIGERNQVLAEIERFRSRVRQEVRAHRVASAAARTDAARTTLEQRWQRQLVAWEEEIAALNRRIEIQNFKQPALFLEIFKLRLVDEIRRAEREDRDKTP